MDDFGGTIGAARGRDRASPPARVQPWRAPWQTRRGDTDALRLVAFVAASVPASWLLGQYIDGDLGARPVKALYLGAGLWAFRLLLVSLAVTPARHVFAWPRVVGLRRMLGVAALAYALAHLVLYTASEGWRVPFVVGEIVSRIYLTIGFVALLGLCALGATSFDSAVRRLGKTWKTLHRLVFAIGVLAALHFYMQSKADVSEAVVVSGCFVWLVLWRLLPDERRSDGWVLLALAPVVGLLTAGLEIAWYGIATHIRVFRVIGADLAWPDDWDAVRPAHWVFLAALSVPLLAAAVRLLWRGLEAVQRRRPAVG